MSIALMLLMLAAQPAEAESLSIAPGETIVFRLEGDRPVAVRNSGEPAVGELSAVLSVDGGQTLLHMTNNTERWLSYRAEMELPNGRKVRTSVCTLPSNNRGGFEFWPQPLKSVRISKFRAAPADRMSCQ